MSRLRLRDGSYDGPCSVVHWHELEVAVQIPGRPGPIIVPPASVSDAYLLDGEPIAGGLEDFVSENDFDDDVVDDLRSLEPGETYRGGGGAWAAWTLARLA